LIRVIRGRICSRMNQSALPPLPAEPRPGRYRHYKGREYRVVGIARHSETLEPLVVYEELYGEHGLWVRPAAMFNETVAVGESQARVSRFAFVAAE
jgi:hypothetical protein